LSKVGGPKFFSERSWRFLFTTTTLRVLLKSRTLSFQESAQSRECAIHRARAYWVPRKIRSIKHTPKQNPSAHARGGLIVIPPCRVKTFFRGDGIPSNISVHSSSSSRTNTFKLEEQ